MKINLFSVTLFFMTLAVVKGHRFSKFNKPEPIDLTRKPQITTPKLPEERRKLDIFPKSLVKFVVTSPPYSKVRTYSPYPITTRKPAMLNLISQNMRNIQTTRAPLSYTTIAATTQFVPRRQFISKYQFTTRSPVEQIPKDTYLYDTEEEDYIEAPSTNDNVVYNSENILNSFDENEYEDEEANATKTLNFYPPVNKSQNTIKEIDFLSKTDNKVVNINDKTDLLAVESNDSNKVNINETIKSERNDDEKVESSIEQPENKEEEGKVESKEPENEASEPPPTAIEKYETKDLGGSQLDSKEIENTRKKRLTSMIRGVIYNVIEDDNKPIKEEIESVSEKEDRDEFIFIRDYLKAPIDIKKAVNNIPAVTDEYVEIATEIASLEEYSRPERSVNIIEEENMGTTVSGFKFTGREPRVNSDLVFKNINA
ncbi:uncharacterized protein LOC114351666 [Ostrinia furnacalis]|uniref:uncharacterized protein LOC114351666 n=1 Tax=Ostrinia furnacalis TaxID=93504 RepID=UPI001039439A|nr:uncharacterized protein LOC114351666 [Ostrinia furnacalis]